MSTAIAKIEPARKSLIVDMAHEYGMDPDAFQKTLKATVVPPNVTNEDFAAFLLVAKHYKLNPILKEIFAFPKRGGGIQPIVSVDGWANLVNSQPQCDGFEFIDALDGDGGLVSITCKIYRKDRKYPGCATEYMEECVRATDTWKQWPRRMLRHKALIQAARYTFGFAGIMEPDEAERATPEPAHYAGMPGPRLTPPPAPKAETEVTTANTGEEPKNPPVSDAAYAEMVKDSYDEMNGCETENQVEELRDRVLDELKVGDREAWKSRCAERAAEIFGSK
jgi:phage recombination protein Bet